MKPDLSPGLPCLMRLVAKLGLMMPLTAAVLLFGAVTVDARQIGGSRPAPEPLRPPSPDSCLVTSEIELPVTITIGRGSLLGEQVHCAGSGDAIIRAELPPGETAQAWLLLTNNGEQPVEFSLRQTQAAGSRIGVESDPFHVEPGDSIRLLIHLDIDPETDFGTAFLHQINVELITTDDQLSLTLPVRLEAIDPDELFRQRFEVEPVLGQFL